MRRENAKSSGATEAPDKGGEGGFFRRWSRRKRRALHGEAEDAPAVSKDPDGPPTAGEKDAEPERVLTDEDMPPLETLNEDSDFSGFMSPGVSDSLRNLALRKMFLSSKYNFTDGLDDYAEDFTKFTPLGNIVTADMRHRMEMEAERAKEKLEAEARAAMEDVSGGEKAGAQTGRGESPEGGADESAEAPRRIAGGDAHAGTAGDGSADDEAPPKG